MRVFSNYSEPSFHVQRKNQVSLGATCLLFVFCIQEQITLFCDVSTMAVFVFIELHEPIDLASNTPTVPAPSGNSRAAVNRSVRPQSIRLLHSRAASRCEFGVFCCDHLRVLLWLFGLFGIDFADRIITPYLLPLSTIHNERRLGSSAWRGQRHVNKEESRKIIRDKRWNLG